MSDYQSALPVRTEQNGDVVAKIADGTTSTQLLSVDSQGNLSVKLKDGYGNALDSTHISSKYALDIMILDPVSGSGIDPRIIRALTAADVVSAAQSGTWNITDITGTISLPTGAATEATLAAINNKLVSGTDIGDVTVNNAAGAAAVNIQDGGNSITVDAVNLDIRDLTAADVVTANQGAANTIANAWAVHPTDGTNSQAYLATGEAKVAVTQPLPAGSNNIGSVESNTRDGSGNQITSVSGGAHRGLDVALMNSTGPIDTTNPLPVVISNAVSGTEVLDFKQASAVAAAASDTHTYTVTAGKTCALQQIVASGSGKIKVEISFGAALKIVLFNSTSSPNVNYVFANPQAQAAGTTINVKIYNLDKQAQDLYSSIEGVES